MSPSGHLPLELPLELDPHRAAAALSRAPGTVLLRRDPRARLGWAVSDAVLLFDPLWTLTVEASGEWVWTGTPPRALTALRSVLEVPGRCAALLTTTRQHGPVSTPLIAGWIGYDRGAAALGARHPMAAPGGVPDAWIAGYDTALVCSESRTALIVSDARAISESRQVGRGAHSSHLISRQQRALETLHCAAQRDFDPIVHDLAASVRPLDREWHRRAVGAIHEHLRAGDSYQINLTGQVHLRTRRSPWEVFETESMRNPVGFAAYLNTGSHEVTSHSPELLLRLRGRRALTAPIKGTAAASTDAEAQLAASAKDRAEHVMIVDLCRNDLGRHASPGSVRVERMMQPLELRDLVHMMSEVRAELSVGARDRVFGDLFPGGSITGAPKRRSCEIIRELEQCGRGPYTGAIGCVYGSGDMDWNIAIRTALWHNGQAWFGCGGGIVLDSDPEYEYEEAMLKAQSFLSSARGDAALEAGCLASAAHTTAVPDHGAP